MVRISFRQGMLAGFVLIALLLGGTALRSWLVVERFAQQNRQGSEQALQLMALIQELGEASVNVERSTRQYLVLHEGVRRQRCGEQLTQALGTLERLESMAIPTLSSLLENWRETAADLERTLAQTPVKQQVQPLLARLSSFNNQMNEAGRHWVDEQNTQAVAELEANRLHLGAQLLGALLGALLVALAMGWWLVRPIRHLEHAIGRLGENRYDQAVQVQGPVDIRRLGRSLDGLRLRLAQLETERERTLRHVSHELKTPLTALREGVALLDDEVAGPLITAQKEVVDILQHNVMVLQGQIEGLLKLNAAAFDARRLHYRSVALRPLLAAAVSRRELQIQARQIQVSQEAPDSSANLDEEKMAVILDNLLSNAIEFSPVAGHIRLSAHCSDKRVCLECIDTGPGVAEADIQRIFQPFVQGRRHPSTPRRGSGVGLSIVRELTLAMGGQVVLVPTESGAHFQVEVPNEN